MDIGLVHMLMSLVVKTQSVPHSLGKQSFKISWEYQNGEALLPIHLTLNTWSVNETLDDIPSSIEKHQASIYFTCVTADTAK